MKLCRSFCSAEADIRDRNGIPKLIAHAKPDRTIQADLFMIICECIECEHHGSF